RLIGDKLREAFRSRLRARVAYLLLRRDVERLREGLDAGEVGGALLLGLGGVAVKAHGASDARAGRNAIAVAANLAKSAVSREMAQGMAATIGLGGVLEPGRGRRLWESIRGRLRRDGKADEGGQAEPPPASAGSRSGAKATPGSEVKRPPGAREPDRE